MLSYICTINYKYKNNKSKNSFEDVIDASGYIEMDVKPILDDSKNNDIKNKYTILPKNNIFYPFRTKNPFGYYGSKVYDKLSYKSYNNYYNIHKVQL